MSLEVLSKAGPDITARVVDPGGASGPVGHGAEKGGHPPAELPSSN